MASLRRLTIHNGMDPEQAASVLGPPRKRRRLADGAELWVYDKRRAGVRGWYYSWGTLRFENGVLTHIEAQHINIHK
jgi:hypothetical protein